MHGTAPISSSQSGAFSSSYLNSSITTVLKGSNSTDSANWDSSSATTAVAGVSSAWFGPGATNDTSYLWGLPSSAPTSTPSTGAGSCGAAAASACTVYTTSSIRKRTINNTIVGWGNDTAEASVIGDTSITTSIMGTATQGIGPGYLAVLSQGIDSAATPNNQVWITLISGVSGSATSTKLTSTADVYASVPAIGTACTITTFGLGNVWYNIGTGTLFYIYYKKVVTDAASTSAGACLSTGATTAYSIYLGGIYLRTAYWTTSITVSAVTTANPVSSLMSGVDNTNAASYIYLTYKDNTAAVLTTYDSKTAISANTFAVGSFSALMRDTTSGTSGATGTYITYTYSPASVWSSNNTYAITLTNTTVSVVTASGGGTSTSTIYAYTNFFNGTTTGVDSGFTSGSGIEGQAGFYGWQLNTGYTSVAAYESSTSPYPSTYYFGTFWANGTVNSTAVTFGSLTFGAPQFYED